MLSAAQVEQFKADGFVRGGRVLDDDQVRRLCDELSRVIRDKDNHDVTQPVRFFNIGGKEPPDNPFLKAAYEPANP